jgi:hypothetical protein
MFHSLENLFHLPFGVVNAGFDGALGATDNVGDFQDGEVLKKMQNKDLALFNAKPA